MILDDVRYVGTFPQTFSLQNAIEVDLESIDVIGVGNFCVYDSLIIFFTTNKEGFLSFVSLPDYKFIGKFLTMGQGPYEFVYAPSLAKTTFFREKEDLMGAVYQYYQGKLYQINIDESIKNRQLSINTINDNLPKFLFDFAMIDSTTFFCREISDAETKQIRYLLVDNKKITPAWFEQLNQASIRKGEDFNILSTIIKYNSERNMIVESPVGLNYINLYSIDGAFGKTICIGDRLDHIGKIQNKMRWNRIDTFTDPRLFCDFWGVIYINEDMRTYQIKRERLPEILLFDWSGKPLAKLNLNAFITSFDIDFINGYLYTLDAPSDRFCKYDIRAILEQL